tara:strand:- start:576 stop:1076 length:501 start_codon:yes stop_codon:yes gene_type:complete
MYRKNQYSIDNSEEKIRGRDVAYISKYIKDNSFSYEREDGGLYKGKYIPNFQSFRKVNCIVEDKEVILNTDKNIKLKVFNPYKESIELSKLKFAVTYMDNHKIPKETLNIALETVEPNSTLLKKQDTTNFTFHLPKTKMENIGYFRVVISENNLYFGLNGKPIPIQ